MTETYTKTEREQIAEAFSEALALLWDGESEESKKRLCQEGSLSACEYICNILNHLSRCGVEGAEKAKTVVMWRLGGYTTFYSWLMANGVEYEEMSDRNVQAHKKAWLRMLVEEFKTPQGETK